MSRFKIRYIVLTSSALHWFKKSAEDLFGDEKGAMQLDAIVSVTRATPTSFTLVCEDHSLVSFNIEPKEATEDWLSALAIARKKVKQNRYKRRQTLSGVDFLDYKVGG